MESGKAFSTEDVQRAFRAFQLNALRNASMLSNDPGLVACVRPHPFTPLAKAITENDSSTMVESQEGYRIDVDYEYWLDITTTLKRQRRELIVWRVLACFWAFVTFAIWVVTCVLPSVHL